MSLSCWTLLIWAPLFLHIMLKETMFWFKQSFGTRVGAKWLDVITTALIVLSRVSIASSTHSKDSNGQLRSGSYLASLNISLSYSFLLISGSIQMILLGSTGLILSMFWYGICTTLTVIWSSWISFEMTMKQNWGMSNTYWSSAYLLKASGSFVVSMLDQT